MLVSQELTMLTSSRVCQVLQADSTVDLLEEGGLLCVLREREFEELERDGLHNIRLVQEGTENVSPPPLLQGVLQEVFEVLPRTSSH